MVTRIAIILVVATGVAVAAPTPTIEPQVRKFDHARHDAEMTKDGHPVPACQSCHQVDPKTNTEWKVKSGWGGKLSSGEHNRCFGACHGKDGDHDYHPECSSLSGAHSPAKVCQVCHPVKARCRPGDLPAAQGDAIFGSGFTHGKHLSLGVSIEKDCAYCHKNEAAGQPPLTARPHIMCGGCHNTNGAKPAITDCAGCHGKRIGPAAGGGDPYRLKPFDHTTHFNTSHQASCTGCHDKLVGAAENALPRPSMMNCQMKCHDGSGQPGKAFATTGTRCTTCHKGSEKPPPVRQDKPFNHAEHDKRNANTADCAQCHSVQSDGKLDNPGTKKEHMPCAKSGCHQTEFMARQPKICGVCHDTIAPWQKNSSRPGQMLAGEWFETMNHQSHIKAAGTGTGNATCQGCHGEKFTANATMPRNHQACAPCHGKSQKPAMSECAACHSRTKAARAPVSQWAVTANFKHQTHGNDPRSKRATNCLECHSTVAGAKDLASVTAPKMAQCDGCHDGKTSFKTTGFGCARCHAPPAQPQAAATLPAGATAMLEVRDSR